MATSTPPLIRSTARVMGVVLAFALVSTVVVLSVDLWLQLFAACLVALFLRGLSDRLCAHTPLGPKLSLTLVVLVVLGITAGTTALLAPSVVQQAQQFHERMPRAIERVQEQLPRVAGSEQLLQRIGESLQDPSNLEPLRGVLSVSFGAIISLVVIVVAGIYFAADPALYKRGVVRLFPVSRRDATDEILSEMGHTLQLFLLGRVVSMVAVGIATGLGLWLLGVPLPAMLGVVAGTLTFVPYAGPIAAGIPIMLVALTEGISLLGWALLLYMGIQMVEGFFITPMVQERVVHLAPVTTLAAEVLLGMLFGPFGVVLSVPLAAALLVVIRRAYIEGVLEREAAPGTS